MSVFTKDVKVGYNFKSVDKRYREPSTKLPENWTLSDDGNWFVRKNCDILYYTAEEIVDIVARTYNDDPEAVETLETIAKDHFEQAKIRQREKFSSEIYEQTSSKALQAMKNAALLHAGKLNDAVTMVKIVQDDEFAKAYYQQNCE